MKLFAPIALTTLAIAAPNAHFDNGNDLDYADNFMARHNEMVANLEVRDLDNIALSHFHLRAISKDKMACKT